MGKFGNWLRRVGERIATGFRHFMTGRYGGDKLNNMLVYVAFGAFLINLLIPYAPVHLAMMVIYYTLLGIALFRMLSRNTYKRYQENRKYLRMLDRFKDKEHKYFDCPRCRQPVRVPRGKGKISITCPKCAEKFIKKT